MGLSFRDIAKRLQIGVGSAYRLYRRFTLAGEFSSKKKRARRPDVRKLDEHHELYIMGLLMENPGLYLIEQLKLLQGYLLLELLSVGCLKEMATHGKKLFK